MESRLKTLFWLYKSRANKKGQAPIVFRITINNLKTEIYTGIFIDLPSWDSNKEKVRGKNELANEINSQLVMLKSKAVKAYNALIEKEIPITAEGVKLRINGDDEDTQTLLKVFLYHNSLIERGVGTTCTKATLTKYRTLEGKIKKYLHHQYQRKDIFLKELNHQFIVNFEVYLKKVEGISHNPTIKYIQFLKKIINMAIAHSWLDKNPFQNFKCSLKEVERGYLSKEELDKIRQKEIANERLTIVKDIFVFCCYTGLSYADVKKLTTHGIVVGVDGSKWINSIRKKTGTRISVPILPIAAEMLAKYESERKGNLLPVLSNQKMNAYLKEIGDICGVQKKLTFHLARHTFATTVTLSNGVPIETVSKMLGHTNLKTTQIYAKVVDTKISEDMKALKNKLFISPKTATNDGF